MLLEFNLAVSWVENLLGYPEINLDIFWSEGVLVIFQAKILVC